MEIRFEVPTFIEDVLRAQGDDPNQIAKEVVLIGWFRRGLIDHEQLARALGLDRFEADAVLKRHGVEVPPTHEVLAPIHEEFCRSGMSEDELSALIEQAREAAWQEKQRGDAARVPDPWLGSLREDAAMLDEIGEEAMTIREERPRRRPPGE